MNNYLSHLSLEGKVALVTGASRGIGQAIAENLAILGATVIGTATSESGVDSINTFFKKRNLNVIGKILNINNTDYFSEFVSQLVSENGGVHILVNNAGITRDNLLLRMKPLEWNEVINTNLTGTAMLSKAVLKPMIKSRWGRIINISSVVGIMGNAGQCNYAAAKAGLIGFSKSLAREVASRGITVNTIAPGFINTDMTQQLSETQKNELLTQIPSAKLGQVEDISNAVAFLASSASNYITGETLHINGGMLMP